MKWLYRSVFLFFLISGFADQKNVALCVVATGKYDVYAQKLVQSARSFFLKNHAVTYLIFTDGDVEPASDVLRIQQNRLGWPYDTMMRFEIYLNHQHLLEEFDYIFAVDADMLFVAEVGEEILSDRVGTLHPGFYQKRGTYETKKRSTACVKKNEGQHYFAGGFYGGGKEEFLKLLSQTSLNIRKDLEKKVIALWHDESHLNRYFIDHPPTKILDPSYCYPENLNLPFPKRLIALDKNHTEMRN